MALSLERIHQENVEEIKRLEAEMEEMNHKMEQMQSELQHRREIASTFSGPSHLSSPRVHANELPEFDASARRRELDRR